MICGYKKKGRSNAHLEFGSLYHSALETYDKSRSQGHDHTQAQRSALRHVLVNTWAEGKPLEFDHNLKTRRNLVRSVIWYLEQFADDPATTVQLADGRPAVELSFRLPVDHGLVLCGHLDRVVEYQGSKFVMDRKTTTSTISSYYFDRYSPDNQMSLYTLAGRIILNSPIRGVIIDAVQIAVGFSRFERGMVYRSEGELEEWLNNAYFWIGQAQRMAENPTEANFPQNDKSCSNYGGCPFQSICSSDPRVRKSFLESNFGVDPWNPLKTRT